MSSDDLLAQAKAELARIEGELAHVRAQHRAEIAEFNGELKRVRGVIRMLTPKPKRAKRAAALQAGPKALDAVRAALRGGPLSQAQIVRETKLNDGTVSYALRALVAETGEVVPTGARIGGSREFKLRGRAAKAA